MAYYRTCPDCGGSLDPGEKCDCHAEKERRQEFFVRHFRMEPKSRQMAFVFDGKYGEVGRYAGEG